MKNNIAIYWGGFNPPTIAHAQVIEKVLQETDIHHIIMSPSGEREDKDFNIPQKDRRTLVETFITTLQEQGISIDMDDFFFWSIWNSLRNTLYFQHLARCRLKFHLLG